MSFLARAPHVAPLNLYQHYRSREYVVNPREASASIRTIDLFLPVTQPGITIVWTGQKIGLTGARLNQAISTILGQAIQVIPSEER